MLKKCDRTARLNGVDPQGECVDLSMLDDHQLVLVACTDANCVIVRIEQVHYACVSKASLYGTVRAVTKTLVDSSGHGFHVNGNLQAEIDRMMEDQDTVLKIRIVRTEGKHGPILVLACGQLDLRGADVVPISWDRSALLLWPAHSKPVFGSTLLTVPDLAPRNHFLRDVHRVYGQSALMLLCVVLGHMASVWHCDTRHNKQRLPLLLVGPTQLAKSTLLKCAAGAVGCSDNVHGALDTVAAASQKMPQLALVVEDLKEGKIFDASNLRQFIRQQYDVGSITNARQCVELNAALLVSLNDVNYNNLLSADDAGNTLRSRFVCFQWTGADYRAPNGPVIAPPCKDDQEAIIVSIARLPFLEDRCHAIYRTLPETLKNHRERQAVAVDLCYAGTIMDAYLASNELHAPVTDADGITLGTIARERMSSWPEEEQDEELEEWKSKISGLVDRNRGTLKRGHNNTFWVPISTALGIGDHTSAEPIKKLRKKHIIISQNPEKIERTVDGQKIRKNCHLIDPMKL